MRVIALTRGQIADKINQAVTKFEIDVMGRGPKEINTIINKDLIIVRMEGFFSVSEQKLARNDGVEMVKRYRTMLFENEEERFRNIIENIINSKVVSVHSDVSTRTGEKIIVLTIDQDLEKKFK